MWADLVAWFQSPGGARVLQTAIIPAVAILVAGLLAAVIARAALRAAIRRADRTEATAAVAALMAAAQAASRPGADRGSGRRGARLRAEADVRMRLLPLPGAELAAAWAEARIDALQQRSADGPVTSELGELRDRLVAWVSRPARAKRLFAAPAAPPEPDAEAPSKPVAKDAERPRRRGAKAAATAEAPTAEPTAPREKKSASDRPSPAVAVAATPSPEPAPAQPAAASATNAGADEGVPAWQRTRAGERLQQERARTRGVEAPTEQPDPTPTAPVAQHPHRADAPPAPDSEAVRLETHQQARHARPTEAVPTATGTVPAASTNPAPAWLDEYDDEAQVTQNMDLKTPPPVAASAVRDRGAGENLLPRS